MCICLLLPIPVAAGNHITVVAVPNINGGIVSFTATVITDTQVQLDWVMKSNTVAVIVRAKYSTMPISRTDGYLVYSGDLNTATDTSMNLDETAGFLYYRIWAQNNMGVWLDTDVNIQNTEGLNVGALANNLLLGIIAFLAVVLNIGAFVVGKRFLAVLATLFWVILGVIGYVMQTITTTASLAPIYYAIFWAGMGMGIASILEAATMKDKDTQTVTELVEPLERQSDLEIFGQKMAKQRQQLTAMRGSYEPQKTVGTEDLQKQMDERRRRLQRRSA